MQRKNFAGLPDGDLDELRRELTRALESGLPFSQGVRKYGIRDLETLEQWLTAIAGEQKRRGDRASAAAPSPRPEATEG